MTAKNFLSNNVAYFSATSLSNFSRDPKPQRTKSRQSRTSRAPLQTKSPKPCELSLRDVIAAPRFGKTEKPVCYHSPTVRFWTGLFDIVENDMTKAEMLALKVGDRVRYVGFNDGGHEVIEVGYNAVKVKWPEGVGIMDSSHAPDMEKANG